MNCKGFERLIYAFDQLNDGQKDELLEHIQDCAKCKRTYKAVTKKAADLKALNNAALPDGLNEYITERVISASRAETADKPNGKDISARGKIAFNISGAPGNTRNSRETADFQKIALRALKPFAAAFCVIMAFVVLLSFIGLSLTNSAKNQTDGYAANGKASQSGADTSGGAPFGLGLAATDNNAGSAPQNSASNYETGGAPSNEAVADTPESQPPAQESLPAISVDIPKTTAISTLPDIFRTEKVYKSVNISLITNNITEMARFIQTLPGVTVNSSLKYYNAADFATDTDALPDAKYYGEGFAERRVSVNELDFLRQVLRSAAEVTGESESQIYYTAEYDELAARAQNAENEIAAVSVFIGKSLFLDDIFYVEGRISEIDLKLDGYLGRMRQINEMTKDARVNIYFSANPPPKPVPPPPPPPPPPEPEKEPTFFERMAEAFTASLNFTKDTFESFTLFLAAIIAPLSVIAVIIAAVLIFIRKRGAKL